MRSMLVSLLMAVCLAATACEESPRFIVAKEALSVREHPYRNEPPAPANPEIAKVNAGERVEVVSTVRGEDYKCFKVRVAGETGYVKYNSIKMEVVW